MAADYPDLTIIAQNAAHEKISMSSKKDTIGRKLFDVFPDTSDEYKRTGRSALTESMQRAIKTGKPDSMGETRYDITDKHGNLVERYWILTHYPIRKNGKIVAVYQETKDITEERVIEETLERTKTQLEQILTTSLVATWTWDIKNGTVIADKNLADMFGIPRKEALKGVGLDRFVEAIHFDDRERIQKEIEKAVSTGEPYETEYRTYDGKGNIRWVLARGQVERHNTDAPRYFSGTIIDLTDRKLAEEVMSESDKKLRFMADSMPQLVWISGPDGTREYYNKQWYDYTGTKPGTIGGSEWDHLYHPADLAKASKAWRSSLKTGEPFEIEFRLFHAPSDSYRWVIGRALPHFDSQGSIIKWYGTCTDIDEHKRISEQQSFLADVSKELASTLDRHKMLTNITKRSIPVISDWCSVDLYSEERGFEQISVAHVNPKKVKLATDYRKHNPLHIDDDSGIPRMLKTGQPEFYPKITPEMIEQAVTDKERLEFMQSLNLYSIMVVPLKNGKKTIGGLTFVSSDSGRYFDEKDFRMAQEVAARVSLSLTNAKLYDDSVADSRHRRELEKQLRLEKRTLESRVKERTQQLQLTNQGLRDEIIRRQTAERELNAYSHELSRSNQELEDFAYVASHDLQEPLRKIQAFGNLLLSEYGDSLGIEGVDYLQRMHSAASRMSTLIADLLTFSRVTRKKPVTQQVDLNETVRDVTSDLETRIKDTKAAVSIGKLPTIEADPTHMRQLFQNLIGNAVKFHRPDVTPVVTVKSKVKNDGYEMTVTDNGVGFDEKYLDRIFAVFQRLNERSSYEGTGIGLAVCRKIVERYGGTITATSVKGKGSTFIVWMPHKKVKRRR
jgi:PAS domain S-box-containing protein